MVLDWKRLNKTTEGNRTEFEHFCYHIFTRYFDQYGTDENFYNTAGSESYIVLNQTIQYEGKAYKKGDVIGWQAKYWVSNSDENSSPLTQSHRETLIKGFKKTKQKRTKIKLWIICTPGKFKEDQWKQLVSELEKEKKTCTYISWSKENFEKLLVRENATKYNGIFRYFFDGQFLDKQVLDTITKDTLTKLKEKYDVDLHVPSEIEQQLLSVVDTEKAKQTLRRKIAQLVESVREDISKNGYLDKKALQRTAFSDKYIQTYNQELKNRLSLAEDLAQEIEKTNLLDRVSQIINRVNLYKERSRQHIDELNEELNIITEGTEDKQIPAGTYVYFEGQRERIHFIDRLIWEHVAGSLNLEQALSLIDRKIHSVFAEPGYGKTHFACSVATNLIKRAKALPVLFLQGRDFSTERTIADILSEKLHFERHPSLDDIADMLDFLGESHDCRLPIIIDGLNESDPNSKRWKSDLPELGRRIEERNHLLLITTCRSQNNYLRVIYGKEKVSEIVDSYELSGINPYDLKIAVKKYFDKYDIRPNPHPNLSEFQHPLLLKIFCTVNKGKHDFDIYGTSLTESMQKYSEQMIESVADKEKPDYDIRRYEIKNGLCNYAQTIWDTDLRDMLYVPDFYEKFEKHEYAQKIVDEGCCSTEMEATECYVHFTYDMIAGYHIAEQLIATHPQKADFVSYITSQQAKLFGKERHTYGQDIVKSLVFLVPQKYGEQWSTLVPTADTVAATIENLDGVFASANGRETLQAIIANSKNDNSMKEQLCECIYHRVQKEHNLSHFKEFLQLFAIMQPSEIDEYWNGRFITYPEMQSVRNQLHDDYVLEMYNWDDIISYNIVMCGVMDREFHEIYHKLLFKHALVHFDEIDKEIFKIGMHIPDAFIFESIVTVLTGIGLRAEEQERYCVVVRLLEDYMQEYTSNCVLLLDAIETLYSYGEYKWGEKHNRAILSKNKSEKWPVVNYREANGFGLFDYDFDKFNIRPLFSYSYTSNFSRKKLSEAKVYGMLLARCRLNGYKEDVCAKLNNAAYEKASYRSLKHIGVGEKYGRFALMELYGWLILNGYINPVFKDTFRVEMFDVDPSMPQFPQKRSLISRSFMPKSWEDLGKWIKNEDTKFMEGLFIRELPGRQGEWVMMQGRLKQQVTDKYANYYLSGHVELVDEKVRDKAIHKLEIVDSIDMDHKYAAEIGWRLLESREDDDYLDEERRIMEHYGFTGWSGSRYEYCNFECLRTKWALKMGLRFDIKTMTYYDKKGKEASAYFVNDSDLFFYLRKDIVDTMLKDTKSCLRFHIYEQRIISMDIPKERDVYPKKFEQTQRDVIYRIKL